MVPVKRTGGALGPVRVNYTVVYLLPGSSRPSSNNVFSSPDHLEMPTAAYNASIEIQISENSFLQSDAAFLITITSVQLESEFRHVFFP